VVHLDRDDVDSVELSPDRTIIPIGELRMNRPNKFRTKKQYHFGPLDLLEGRVVMTVTPIVGNPFFPPGHYEGSEPNIPTYEGVTVTREISGDTINFTIFGEVGTVVTLGVYRSTGGGPGQYPAEYEENYPGENIAAQRLVFSHSVRIGADGTATYSLDVADLKLNGQRHFQCDWFVNKCDPCEPFCPPDKIVQHDNIEYISGNFVSGELFDFTTQKGGKDKR
jgi:hypothetical protein